MKTAEKVKPISYLKSHTSEIIRNMVAERNPMVITHRGEAKAVLQDFESYEQMQDSIALLKILAMGARDIQEGNVTPARKSFMRIRARIKDLR